MALSDLRTPSGRPTGALFGVANRVREAVERFKPSRVLVCWDGGRSSWRRAVFAGYKDRPRSESSPDLAECFAQRDDLKALLAVLGCDQVEVAGVEADDVIAYYAVAADAPFTWVGCVILSSDRDFYQLVGERVSVYLGALPGKGRTVEHVTLGTFREATVSARLPSGVADPGEWAAYRVVNGDASDRIPGVTGLSGEKRWARVYPTLRRMGYRGDALDFFVAREPLALGSFADPLDPAELATRRAVAERWNLLERNAVLQSLPFAVGMLERLKVNPGKSVVAGAWDERAAERACGRHAFRSALERWDLWRDAFGGLAERRGS